MKYDLNAGEADNLDITGQEDKSEQWEKEQMVRRKSWGIQRRKKLCGPKSP